MNFHKILLASAVTFGLVSAAAFAHPSKTDTKKHSKNTSPNTIKIIDLDGAPFKGRIKIEDFDFDFSQLSADLAQELTTPEALAGLAKLKALTGLNVQTLTDENGEMTILINNNKSGLLSDMLTDMEFDFGDHNHKHNHDTHKKRAKKLKKHLKHLKKQQHVDLNKDSAHPRTVIKKMLRKINGDDDTVNVWIQNHSDTEKSPPNGIEDAGNMVVLLDDEEVKVMKNGHDITALPRDGHSVNIDKSTRIKNGKRTTRIVIEIEELDE